MKGRGRGQVGVLPALAVAAALAMTLGACGDQQGFEAAPAPRVTTATATATVTATATATATEMATVTETATVVTEVTATVTAPAVRGFAGTGGQQKASPKPANVYYQNCTDVRAHGAAPIRRGDPGYGSHLDRDGDGVGCE